MSDKRKSRTWRWIVAALVGLPVLYLLSSGPMHGVAFRNASLVGFDPDGSAVLAPADGWWPKAYAPLIWASEQSWGQPLKRYWSIFRFIWERE
jgi:hypothetical protein